jgi:CubicO group peptidase (beta-lactamase class C family)
MIKNKLVATLSALSLIGSNFSVASETSQETAIVQTPVDRLEGLDAMVNEALETFHVPGAAVGIIIDGKVVLTKGYGFRDAENSLPVTENTLFAIGSCTKAFTTHILGQLADEGKISWDDPVIKYLPEFRLKDEYATSHITIRDLVTHQSGLPRHDFLWYNSDLSRNDLLHRLQYLDPSADLRSKFQYNNLMYVMAGLVIEKIEGITWEEAVHSRILAPLGMNRSNFSVLDSQKSDDFSLPFREKNGSVQALPFNPMAVAGPAGSINSSAADMVKWLGLQLTDGTFEGRQFVKKETLLAMHTPQVALRKFPEEATDFFGYGLGWMVGIHEGRYFVAHGGGIDGFISLTGFLPKEKIGVVVLTNSDSGMSFANSLAMAIFDRTLGIAKEDWIPKVKEKDEKIKSALQQGQEKTNEDSSVTAGTSRPCSDYVGEFEHPGYGTIQVQKKGDDLILSYHTLSIPLTHRCYDHFTGEWEASFNVPFNCSFVRDHFGEISELNMPLESAVGLISFKRKAGKELLATNYLKQFEGLFENELFSLNIAFKGTQLTAIIPGDSNEYALIPEKSLQFSVKGMPGTIARFTAAADGKMTEMLFVTPNGTFNFKAK